MMGWKLVGSILAVAVVMLLVSFFVIQPLDSVWSTRISAGLGASLLVGGLLGAIIVAAAGEDQI